MNEVERVLSVGNELGEGPLWHVDEQARIGWTLMPVTFIAIFPAMAAWKA